MSVREVRAFHMPNEDISVIIDAEGMVTIKVDGSATRMIPMVACLVGQLLQDASKIAAPIRDRFKPCLSACHPKE